MEPTSSTPAEERPEETAPAPIEEPQPEPLPDDVVAEAPDVPAPAAEAELPLAEVPAAEAPVAEPLPPAPEPPAPSPLDLGDAAPAAAEAPDLGAVEAQAPAAPAPATNMDLPSLELPNPVPPAAPTPPPAPATPPPGAPTTPYGTGPSGAGYAENLAHESYGEPAPPTASPYAGSPYGTPGTSAPYAEPPQAEPQYGQPQYGQQPGYGQPPAGQQYGQLVPSGQLSASDESTWATAAHWSSLVASLIGVSFLGPLLVLLIQGPKSPRVRANAVESLNFDLTMMIGLLISFVLMFVVIGFITAPVIAILWFVFKVIATIQTANGQDYKYPLNIRMVK